MDDKQIKDAALQEMADDILSVEEASQILRVGRVAVCRALQRGTLPGVKVGGQWRLSKTRLMEYLAGDTGRAGKGQFKSES